MLQSSLTRVHLLRMKLRRITYVTLLEAFAASIRKIVSVCMLNTTGSVVYFEMIRFAIESAHAKVEMLDISQATNWERVFNVIELVNSTVSAIEAGARRGDTDMAAVCGALRVGTTVSKADFLNITARAERNARMIELLMNIGNELDSLRGGGQGNFYSFLGDDGEKNMDELIAMLKRGTEKTAT